MNAVAEPRAKPLLRGVSHQIAFFVAIAATAVLVRAAAGRGAIGVSSVFGASLATLFGVSALYHRVDWSPAARQRMRRLDHAAIFVLIAGGYTPLLALVPDASGGHRALAMMWIGAAIGVVKSIFWVRAPKWVAAAMGVGLGWLAVFEVLGRTGVAGPLSIGMLVASGTIYSMGAVVYALKRPDPLPETFGYHEVFHALVVVASVCLFAHVWLLLRAIGVL